jgi:biopolymer transport protein ExbB/TolQ
VAIPAVAMYNIFQRRLKSILANTDALGSVLLAHLVSNDVRRPLGQPSDGE